MNINEKRDPRPPKWADSFMERFCRREMLEELQGDLYELFYKRIQSHGIKSAQRLYWFDVIKAYRFYRINKFQIVTHPAMIRNYLVSTLRNLKKNSLYAVINIIGLAIGIASFLLILLHVLDEKSFDKFHPEHKRIYRISENQKNEEGLTSHYATSFYPLAERLKSDIPGIDKTLRIFRFGFSYETDAAQITNPDQDIKFIEDRLFFVDSTLFDVFGYNLKRGDPKTALSEPYSLLLTEEMAVKYFGTNNNLIGKTLLVRDNDTEYNFQVTGILENPSRNSHFQFDFLGSFASLDQMMPWMKNWYHPPVHNYVKLVTHQNPDVIKSHLAKLPKSVFEGEEAKTRSFAMDPVTGIHLHSHKENELGTNGRAFYISIFLTVAFLILFIACINFMNLATSNASNRTKEIGIRKTLGAHRSQLIEQFLGESFFMSALSFGFAIIIVKLTLPYLNMILDKSLNIQALFGWQFVLIMIGTLFLAGLLSGAYPSYFLSSLKTALLVKGKSLESKGSISYIRKGLVTTQFVVSCALIVAVIVVQKQIEYMSNKDLGFRKDQLMNIPLRDTENQMSYRPLKDQWLNIPGVQAITASSGIPTMDGLHEFKIFPQNAAYDSLSVLTLTVDEDFGEVYDLKIAEGRDFSEEFPSDPAQAVVINETLARKLGWENPVGQKLRLDYYFSGQQRKNAEVIGVVKDFNYHSLHKPVAPILMHMIPNSYYHDYLTIKIDASQTSGILASMENHWAGYNANRPFEYSFLDATFSRLYLEESKLKKLFVLFSLIALLISCLGLFALSSYTCARRTKEIGIRKIMGASVGSILIMLSNQFGKLVGLAFILSLPISWYVSRKWLDNFAYHIDLNIGIFLLAGVLAILIAWLTISYHAWRAATTNPVNTLRYE